MNFLLFLGPIIGVAVAIFAVVVIIAVIGAVAGSEEDFDEVLFSKQKAALIDNLLLSVVNQRCFLFILKYS